MKKELLLKIKALAERGIGGEKETAEQLLESLMKKYNISAESLADDFVSKREFERPKEYTWLFVQVCALVIGYGASHYSYKKKSDDKKYCLVDCTPVQAIEIKALFDFYLRAFQADFETFKYAFILKNDLFATDVPQDKMDSITEEQIREEMKARQLARGMDQHQFHKQLDHAH